MPLGIVAYLILRSSFFLYYFILFHFTASLLLCFVCLLMLFCFVSSLVTKSTKIIERWKKIARNESQVERQKCSKKNYKFR